jgi:hypothetical protein
MSLWNSTTGAPAWAPAVRTPKGWAHADTGELLVAFGDTSFTLSGSASTIASVKLSRGRKKYKSGDVIKLLVQFTEPVTVTGTPVIPLMINGVSRNLSYVPTANSEGNAELLFQYTVVPGDSGTAGQVSLSTAAVAATKNILTGNAGITYTAKTAGTGGNSITVAYVVAGTSTALSVGVSGNAITVNVATDGGGAATSTATQVKAAVDASGPASALVATTLIGTGATVVSAVSATNLANGAAVATAAGISLSGGTIQDVGSSVTNSTLTFGGAAPDLSAVTVN